MSVHISQTLYVNRLNEKLSIENLKALLFELFTAYGEIIDIVADDSLKKKGQAFIIYSDISCAMKAINRLQGQMFCGKPLNIAYARSKSNTIALREGTFKSRKINIDTEMENST
eukprot:GDKJ01006057.1.p1 GENE.GDKJ01006057.1~~GDKJ01006057.1.p1  ORF type:complete len:114 (-),score=15.32 GDKJ01006057.1:22-363(-)